MKEKARASLSNYSKQHSPTLAGAALNRGGRTRFHSIFLIAERTARMASGIFIGALVARSLGPSDFGELSFALQILALLGPFAVLGLDWMIVKWTVRETERADRIVSQTLITRLILTISISIFALCYALLSAWTDPSVYILLAILCLIPQSSSTLGQYFLAVRRGDLVLAATTTALLVGGAVRIFYAFYAPSVTVFLIAYLIEYSVQGLAILYAYRRLPSRPRFGGVSLADAWRRVCEALPILPSALVGAAFAATDIIILKWVSTGEELGIYAAAVRITGAWVVLQAALVDAAAPTIMREATAERRGDGSTSPAVIRVLETTSVMSLGAALVVSLFGPLIAHMLYGSQFTGVATVMVIHIWAALFGGWRKISGAWMIAEETLWLALRRQIVGLIVLVALGIPLAAYFGATGMAVGALAGQAVAGFGIDFFGRSTRHHGLAKLRSLVPIETLRAALVPLGILR